MEDKRGLAGKLILSLVRVASQVRDILTRVSFHKELNSLWPCFRRIVTSYTLRFANPSKVNTLSVFAVQSDYNNF